MAGSRARAAGLENAEMPGTRRTPINRQHTPLITPTVLGLYRRALKLRKHAHLSDDDRHAAHAAERDVDRALGVRLWEAGIFRTLDYQHPGRADWDRAAELRRQLERLTVSCGSRSVRRGGLPRPSPSPCVNPSLRSSCLHVTDRSHRQPAPRTHARGADGAVRSP